MPYIKTTTNRPLPPEKMETIKAKLGELAALLGKSEAWLMVDFCENSPLWFKGSREGAALVSVDLYGAAGQDAYSQFTAAVTALLAGELDIAGDRIFVKYMEYASWGWNGRNF